MATPTCIQCFSAKVITLAEKSNVSGRGERDGPTEYKSKRSKSLPLYNGRDLRCRPTKIAESHGKHSDTMDRVRILWQHNAGRE